MKGTRLFFTVAVPLVLLSGRSASDYATEYASSIPDEHSWTLAYNDPVDLAAEVIGSSSSLWSPLGYRVMRAKYTVGRFGAQHGVGYVLLASPRLTVSMVTGGFYGVGSTVGRDILLSVIERSVGSPDLLCRDISNAMISEGLEEYAQAYEIAREFIEEGSLSREDAIEFLDKRWGIYKLVLAERLYNDTVSRSYSVSSQMRDAVVEEITVELQRALGTGTSLPVAEYAHFVSDLTLILENSNIGLMDYRPYLDFESRMEGINALRLDESERFGSSSGNWDPSAVIDFNGMQWLVGPDRDMTWDQAKEWVDDLGGNWRMPTRAELVGLWNAGIRYGNWGPFENSGYFVWSGEVRDSSSAWYFFFSDGLEGWGYRYSGAGRAFAVRSRSEHPISALHSSIRNYAENRLLWRTENFLVRIDDMGGSNFRYSIWPAGSSQSEEPDLVLYDGTLDWSGSGGNHFYRFQNNEYSYECYVEVIGMCETPGNLSVYNNGDRILIEEVIEQLYP